MIEFKIKPFLDAQDVLVQFSMMLHAGGGSRYPNGVGEEQRQHLAQQLLPLMEQLEAQEFALCRRAAERLLRTLERERRPEQIVSEVDDLRRRLLDQAELAACLSLSPKERDLYEPLQPLFGTNFAARFVSSGT